MLKQMLYPLRKKHGELHEKKLKKQKLVRQKEELQALTPSPIAVIGTPTHQNIGDSAIALAEIDFLKRCFTPEKQIAEITAEAYHNYEHLALEKITARPDVLICWHGGGNMGDLWFFEEEVRRRAFTALSGHPIVMMPQTIDYSDSEKGRMEAQRSVRFYNGRPGLVMIAREKTSFEIMNKLYPDSRILLTPDIVLSTTDALYGVCEEKRAGVLMCLRNDPEKAVADEQWRMLERYLESLGQTHRRTDMYAREAVTIPNRKDRVREKMQEFCGAEMVITDRLHGMVFAALTGTPCIAFSNNNHKVKGTYDWISYLPYIKYAETVEEAQRYIPELLSMKNCRFDNTPLRPYFDKLKEVVIEACR